MEPETNLTAEEIAALEAKPGCDLTGAEVDALEADAKLKATHRPIDDCSESLRAAYASVQDDIAHVVNTVGDLRQKEEEARAESFTRRFREKLGQATDAPTVSKEDLARRKAESDRQLGIAELSLQLMATAKRASGLDIRRIEIDANSGEVTMTFRSH